MDKNIVIACAVSLVLSVVVAMPPISKAGESGTTLFSDDFESYSIGTFPSTGGWILVWNGRGTQYQVVSDAYFFSPTKSLQLWGQPNWSSVAQRKFSTDAPVIGYECAIRIDSIGTGGPGREESVNFFNRDVYIWGRGYAAVLFNHDDGEIKAEDGTVLGDWQPGVWYQVKVILDRRTNTYDVWIDGQLKGQGLNTTSTDTHNINAIGLMSDHAGVKVYYDDVRVFSQVSDHGGAAQWNIDFQGDQNHNNTYGQTDPVDYTEWGVYWNIFEVPALSAPWPGPTNYITNPSMDLVDDEGSFGVGKFSLVKFSIVGDAYGWAGGAGADPLTGDYLIILNGFGVTNDPLTWRIIGLAPSTTYRLTYYHLANVLGRGINFVANGVETTVSVPGLSVASALVTTDWGGRITGTADSEGYYEGNWSALTITTVAATAGNPHPADGATGVAINVLLSWSPGDYAASHDVYFGTSSPPVFIGNLAASSHDPGPLEPRVTYYWQVNEVEADGTKHTGDLWSFTTGVKPDDPNYPDITAGLAWAPVALGGTEALIWNSDRVFRKLGAVTTELKEGDTASIASVQGIVWAPVALGGTEALIWNSDRVFHKLGAATTELNIAGVQGIVWAPVVLGGTEALLLTPSKVFRKLGADITELKEDGTTSIFSYDPALVSTVQAVIHHQGVMIIDDMGVLFVGSSGAGIVGKPATTPVAYTGSSTAAVVVPWSTSPSFHSTVLGAAPFINTAMILGPEPVAGVVAGNSMRLFGFYSP